MVTLHHHPLCPHSRFIRLALGEMSIAPSLVEERPWERDARFLELDPSGETPVLVEGAQVAPGAMVIAEYLNETRGMGPGGLRLMPTDPAGRVEVRRLCHWFHTKFFADVSEGVVAEKVYKRYMRADSGGGPPDMAVVRAARSNIRYHLAYVGWLMGSRKWLAGDYFGYADLAAAAHLSCVDYLGDVPWNEDEAAKEWYARVKSRPSFRVLLADRLPGMAPAAQYADLDFLNGGVLKKVLAAEAAALGFSGLRVTTPERVADQGERLSAWLAAGFHGEMGWMAEKAERRAHPSRLWPEARSILVLGMNYGPDRDPLAALGAPDRATISVYAARRDYHEVIKGRLKLLAGKLAALSGAEVKVFADTAPLMEKPAAAAAGLGWQGKHTALVSRAHGNWLFLGFVLTTAELPLDEPESDHCGACRRCLDICPTNAFPKPYLLDASRCIAYLTVEHAGPIAHELRPLMGNRVFGCDDCLAICPWNKFASASRDAKLALRDDLTAPPLAELAALDDAAFRKRFAGTPVKRTGRDRFVRNVLIAIGNSGRRELAEAAWRLLGDVSPLVRGAAVWALSRLLAHAEFVTLAARRGGESDASVAAEWDAALAKFDAVAAP